MAENFSYRPLSSFEKKEIDEFYARNCKGPVPTRLLELRDEKDRKIEDLARLQEFEQKEREVESRIRHQSWQDEKDRKIAAVMVEKIEAETEKFRSEIRKCKLVADLLGCLLKFLQDTDLIDVIMKSSRKS